MRVDWPLAGRDTESRLFGKYLASSDAPAVIVAGTAGVGKTFFASHCLRMAARAGYATVEATATRAASVLPFGALAHLLPTRDASGEIPDRQEDTLRRAATAIAAQATARGVVVLVDDAHLLDNASAALVQHLVVTRTAFVVMTVRSGSPAPDAITALWKDQLADRLELTGLDDDVITTLLPTVLGGTVDPAAIAEIGARSQGNMLFLRELVFGAVEAGTLRRDHGIWRLSGPLAPSGRLTELIEDRLRALAQHERELLEVVAFGEPLGPAEISSFADLGLVERLERQRLLRTSQDGRRLEFRLAHPLYGDVLRAATPMLRARLLARALAKAVEETGARRREDPLRIATFRLAAGEASPELLLSAATTARRNYDFPLAERLARAAHDAGGSFEAALLAAETASLQGRGDQAETELAALAERAGSDTERMRVALLRVDNLAIYQGRLLAGLQVAEQAEAAIVEPAARDEVRARRSTIVLGVEGPRAAAELLEPLLNRAAGRALVWACRIGAHAFGRLGQISRGLDAADKGYAAHLELREPLEWYASTHLFFRCEVLTYAGRYLEAEELAREQHTQALTDHSQEAQAFFAWQLSSIAMHRGDMPTAVAHGQEAVALFSALGRHPFELAASAPLVIALATLGKPGEAIEALNRAASEDCPSYYPIDLLEARAWTAIVQDDLPEARRLLRSAAELAHATGDRVGEASVLSALARIGDAGAVQLRLDELAQHVEGDLVANNARRAALVARGDAPGLARLSQTFEIMGARLLAAECAAEAACICRREGQQRNAAAAEQRSGELAEACGEVLTPALSTADSRVRLTPTEQQIVDLARTGRSNKAIAEELFLSPRTVGNHLYRVYHKLGISGREAL